MIYNIKNKYLRRIALMLLMPLWVLYIIILFFLTAIDSYRNKNLTVGETFGYYFVYEVRKDFKDFKLCWHNNL